MTQTTDCQNTTEAICGGSLPGDTGTHIQHECTRDLFSSVELPSCENGNPDLTIYWFWYDDVCRDNSTYNKYFARVAPNNISVCRDVPGLSITQDSYPTTLATTAITATSVITATSFSTTPQTINDSETPPLLPIILPVALGVIFIILLAIAGSFYYQRRKRNKKPDGLKLKKISSKKNQSSNTQDQVMYDDDASVLESDNGYSIWRPVQQKT